MSQSGPPTTAAMNGIHPLPRSWQPILSVARLTLRAATRYRVVQFLVLLLLSLVVSLPLVLKHDGTALGLTRIVITYSLGSIVTILSFATLWLAVGNLAREVEDGQLQMVAVKPLARWQILFGKWLGIMTVNLLLLTVSAVAVGTLLHWRAGQLDEQERRVLDQQILIARAPQRAPQPDFDALARERLAASINENQPAEFDRETALAKIREQLVARHEAVLPQHVHQWKIPASNPDEPATLRLKFRVARGLHEPARLNTGWIFGDLNATNQLRFETVLTTDSFHELPVPPGLANAEGVLPVHFVNLTDDTFVFEARDGPELLVPEASFTTNLLRGFAILFCWLGLAAALGLTAACRLNFNVAAFFAVSVLLIGTFDGTIANVSERGTIWSIQDPAEITTIHRVADTLLVPMIRLLDFLLGAVTNYSPVENLSLGRAIPWTQVAAAFAQCWLGFGGLLAILAVFAFGRRELANPDA